MSLENGWSNVYSIADSRVMTCGNMICDKCGKKIRGLYLIRDRTNFKHRGNETDERYIYHRECRKNKAWDEYEKNKEEAKRKENEYNKNVRVVLDLMKEKKLCINDLENALENEC